MEGEGGSEWACVCCVVVVWLCDVVLLCVLCVVVVLLCDVVLFCVVVVVCWCAGEREEETIKFIACELHPGR